jgi:type I restriction enzyme S subunit
MENELLEETGYVGDIPEGWKWVKLGDEIELLYGKGLTEKERKNGIYPVYGSSGIIGYHNNYLVKGPGVIIGRKGSVGEVNLSKTDFYPIDTTYYLKLKNDNDIFFFYYLLKTLRLNEINSHSAVPGLSREDIYSLYIPLPPLPEQKAIAEVLSSIDDKIELLHRQNKTLEEMAMTLFRQWFIEPTKDGLPDGWEEVSLGDSDLSKIIPSGIKKFEGFKTYLATGDVEGTLIKGGVEITYNNRPSRANMQPEKYSVWFAKKEGVRKLLMFDDYSNTDKYILSTGFTGLKTNELSHYYIWCFILSEDFQDIKDSLVSGSVQPDIPNEAVLQIFIPRPPNEILLSFNEKVKPLFSKIQFNTSQIQTLEKLRDTLLPKLMSGKVRRKR